MCTSSLFPELERSVRSPLSTAFSAEVHFLTRMPFRPRFFSPWVRGSLASHICRKNGNFKINFKNQRNTCNFTRWLTDCISMWRKYDYSTKYSTDPGGRAVWGVGLRPLFVVIAGPNPTGARMSVSCECCVLSVRGLCGGLVFLRVIVMPR